MSLETLTGLLAGAINVRIDRRVEGGFARVAAGRLVDGDRTGHRIRLVDEITGRLVEVGLTSEHVVAYTPTATAVRSAA